MVTYSADNAHTTECTSADITRVNTLLPVTEIRHSVITVNCHTI
jgi:hypothetical protein